jgi:hypothetical protein
MRSIDEVVLKPGTLRLLNVMSERCRTILIRGETTARVLEKHGVRNYEIFGCPSNLISPDRNLGSSVLQRWQDRHGRLAYAPTFYAYNTGFERSLLDAIGPRLAQIVAQDPLHAVGWARGDRSDATLEWAERLSGFLVGLEGERKREVLSTIRTYFSCEAWLEAYLAVDGVIASRIHGASLGWQAGRASLVVSYDLRTEELSKSMGLPCVKADRVQAGFDAPFVELLQAACSDYDDKRAASAVLLADCLRRADLHPSAHLLALAAEPAAVEAGVPAPDARPAAAWGFLEKYNRDRIGGWVASNQAEPPEIAITLGDREIARLTPITPRQDLGDHAWAFEITVPPDALTANVMQVGVTFTGTGQNIRNSPVITSFAKDDHKKVLVGNDGWLFLTNDSNLTFEQLSGSRPLSEAELARWAEFFLALDRLAQQRGAAAFYLIAPAKEVIFSRFLPGGLQISTDRAACQLARLVKELGLADTQLLYPEDVLRAATAHHTYPKGDTHWTDYGASIATDYLLERMPESFSSRVRTRDLQFEVEYRNTDLRSKLGGACVEPMPVKLGRALLTCTKDNGVINTGRMRHYASKRDDTSGRLLFLHDSFGEWLVPRLAETYAATQTIWTSNLTQAAVSEFQPDVIVFERAERFLIAPPVVELQQPRELARAV